MVKFINNIIGSTVVLFQERVKIGTVSSLVIDSSTGSFLGFFVTIHPKEGEKVVSISNVKGFGSGLVMIDDYNSISEVDDIVKIKRALPKNPEIIKSKVVTEDGQKLGRVTNATISLDSLLLEKIYVDPNLSIKFLASQLIISRDKIVKIGKKKIIVSDEYIAVKEKEIAAIQAPAID